MIYLDYASTTQVDEEILKLYTSQIQNWFVNSESLYPSGVKISLMMEKSRKKISELFSCDAKDLIFTSSGSESNSLAIKGTALAYKDRGKHLITTAVEHPSVLNSMLQLRDEFGFELSILPVDKWGQINLEDLKRELSDSTVLVSMMAINNEVGTILPILEAADIVKKNSKALFHSDMVQLLGKHPLNLDNIDLASFSAHKIHGLKGSGLLYKKHHLKLVPLISGGAQEFSLRGGTSNALVNTLLAKTISKALEQQASELKRIKEINIYFRDKLSKIDDIIINSHEDASPYILSFSHLKLGSEIIMNALFQKSIYVSSRSTCSSKLDTVSPTLQAMGKSEQELKGVIRISLGNNSTKDELDQLISVLEGIQQHVISK